MISRCATKSCISIQNFAKIYLRLLNKCRGLLLSVYKEWFFDKALLMSFKIITWLLFECDKINVKNELPYHLSQTFNQLLSHMSATRETAFPCLYYSEHARTNSKFYSFSKYYSKRLEYHVLNTPCFVVSVLQFTPDVIRYRAWIALICLQVIFFKHKFKPMPPSILNNLCISKESHLK